MSEGMGATTVERAASQNLNATADVLTIEVVKPIDIIRFGFIVDGATASGTDVVVALDRQPLGGTRVELDTLQPLATVEQGDGVFKDVIGDGTLPSAPGKVSADPGDEVFLEVTTAAGVAATGHVFVEYVERPFVGERIDNMTEVA